MNIDLLNVRSLAMKASFINDMMRIFSLRKRIKDYFILSYYRAQP